MVPLADGDVSSRRTRDYQSASGFHPLPAQPGAHQRNAGVGATEHCYRRDQGIDRRGVRLVGWHFVNPANHIPYTIPAGTPGHEGVFKHGWGGVLGGAGIVFFAFIGFDAVSTAAQEAKDPARDMPIGIMGSLAICTVLYITLVTY